MAEDQPRKVRVVSTLPVKVELRLHEPVGDPQQGLGHHVPVGDPVVILPGTETEVDAEFMRAWLEQNADVEMVRSKAITVIEDDGPAAAED